MIPRLQPRGRSFSGACDYVLHDLERATTNDRVSWSLTVNLSTADAKWAWHEMTDTYWAQDELKRTSGVDSRGRKNDKPVLHYSLSWHESDKPTQEQMKEAALASLKALGLSEHEALIAAHADKKHPHLHIIVNTVHPQNGRTADLKFPKLALSRWAQEYEQEHGLHCEERVKNNAERERQRKNKERDHDPTALLTGKRFSPDQLLRDASQYPPLPTGDAWRPAPDKPPIVRDRSPPRRIWVEQRDVIDRMRRMRAEQEVFHKVDRTTDWQRHRQERQELWQDTKSALRVAREYVDTKFKPQWRELYKIQKEEKRFIERASPLERAVFVFMNRYRLGNGKPLKKREMSRAIKNPGRLLDLLGVVHERERAGLAQMQRAVAHSYNVRITDRYAQRHNALLSRQSDERHAKRLEQFIETRKVTFKDARDSLIDDGYGQPKERPFKQRPEPEVAEPFKEAARDSSVFPGNEPPVEDRAAEIKREMEEWRRKNKDRDHGREM